jgi:hypothetical protein
MWEASMDEQLNNGGSHYSLHLFYDVGAESPVDSIIPLKE